MPNIDKLDDHLAIYQQFDPPYDIFDRSMLGPEFADELSAASKIWFRCGYTQGITSYLNFFILKDFITTHDTAYPPRFQSFKSMALSFYHTDLFIRDVTDTGLKPTGGISDQKVRQTLASIMKRHQRINIPPWMMTYFGFSLIEMVEKASAPVTTEEKRLHFKYMVKAYRLMGLSFSPERDLMEAFARKVETIHAGPTPQLEKHTRNILLLGEMVGVSSDYANIGPQLPEATRHVFQEMYPRVRPPLFKRVAARAFGPFAVPKAVGRPRPVVPVENER